MVPILNLMEEFMSSLEMPKKLIIQAVHSGKSIIDINVIKILRNMTNLGFPLLYY